MLLYICACLILSVSKSSQVKALETSNVRSVNDGAKKNEAIFADVIKNISRVNHVLQDLINNYEQLQKIYKSQENEDSVYTDSEIDEAYKNENGKSRAKLAKGNAVTEKGNFAATQMYWSDNEQDNESSNEDDSEDENETAKKTMKKNHTLEPKTETTSKTKQRKESSEESDDESSDMDTQEDLKQYKGTPNNPKKIAHPAKSKTAEVVFIDTHKKSKKITTSKPRIKMDSVVQFAGVPHKTRYSKVSHSKATNAELQAHNLIQMGAPKVETNERDVKKIVYAESFSPKKIWNDIINNKPIQLEAHNEITLRRVDKTKDDKKNETEINKRSKTTKKPAVELITINKDNRNDETSSSEEDLTIKDQQKTNALREQYGDACLKLVLRKCHKACKTVSKVSCRRVKCKRGVKTTFIDAAKTGCITEFNGVDSTATTKQIIVNPMYTNFRGKDGDLADMTREGFLSAACLPHIHENTPHILRNATQKGPVQNFNILRDRFERACKRVSSDKCQKACQYAVNEMCKKHKCTKRFKKIFKNACKRHCKQAYGLFKAKSDSDESESETESESESESESE